MNLDNLNLVELNAQEVESIDGGFIPLIIFGVAYTASQVAAGMGIAFGAGLVLGSTVYLAD